MAEIVQSVSQAQSAPFQISRRLVLHNCTKAGMTSGHATSRVKFLMQMNANPWGEYLYWMLQVKFMWISSTVTNWQRTREVSDGLSFESRLHYWTKLESLPDMPPRLQIFIWQVNPNPGKGYLHSIFHQQLQTGREYVKGFPLSHGIILEFSTHRLHHEEMVWLAIHGN